MKRIDKSLSDTNQLQPESDQLDQGGGDTQVRSSITSTSSATNAAKDAQPKCSNATANTSTSITARASVANHHAPSETVETSGGGSAKKVTTAFCDAPLSSFPPYYSRTAANVDTSAAFGVTTTTTKQEVSFLDSLTDEERRTRSRHIPNVQGFRRLHKSEIKHDLKVAKVFGGFAVIDDDDELDKSIHPLTTTDDESISTRDVSEESAISDEIISTNATNEDVSGPFVVPCTYSDVIRDVLEASNAAEHSKNSKRCIYLQSPRTVEAITAFNPPRPTESSASMKKKRMIRWEHNPEDITQDLTNYKNMVRQTRSQLQQTESERQRVEEVGEHLRMHYFHLLKAMREESNSVDKETQKLQRKAVLEAELTTTRTKNKGKTSMRDVLSVLTSRGERISSIQNGLPDQPNKVVNNSPIVADNAFRYLVPGDIVSTCYGSGVVEKVFGFRKLTKNSHESEEPQAILSLPLVIPPNVRVRLPFGILYTLPNELHLISQTNVSTDVNLLSRWRSMISSVSSQSFLDSTGAVNIPAKDGYEYPSNDAAAFYLSSRELVQENNGDHNSTSSLEAELVSATSDGRAVESQPQREHSNIQRKGITAARQVEGHRLIPILGGTLPVAGHHGSLLDEYSLLTVQDSLDRALHSGEGVLGKPSNNFVTTEFKDWEARRQQLYNMKGKVLTLRNQLSQERRARIASERGHIVSQERMERVEMLLSEMKVDLQSLKNRLNEELTQLGISQSRAREMLSAAVQENMVSEERPRRRARKSLNSATDPPIVPRTSRRKSDEGMKPQDKSLSYVDQQEYSSNLYSRRGKRGRVEESQTTIVGKKRTSRR